MFGDSNPRDANAVQNQARSGPNQLDGTAASPLDCAATWVRYQISGWNLDLRFNLEFTGLGTWLYDV